jgi:kojibiose phosphorylase
VGGVALRLDSCELLEQRRVLDMRQGALLRTWRLRDADGRVTMLASLRFASLAQRHALGQILLLRPENYTAEVTIEALIDGRVRNENDTPHLGAVHAEPLADAPLELRTLQSGYRIALAQRAELRDDAGGELPGEPVAAAEFCGTRWSFRAEQGRAYAAHRLVAVVTSRDDDAPARAAEAIADGLLAQGMAAALAAHSAAWAERWSTTGPLIPGDAELQLQARFACYHLIGAASPDDERSSIGARALTGERYRGHVFWDTEIFAWPPLLYTHPATARALLMYRYHTLAGARARAAASGYRGAMFPWEAADTGEEVTPAFMLSGVERVPVLTGSEEQHISADVALAVLQYGRATGDAEFMRRYGAELVLDVARFWASRAESGADGSYHIRGVIGPDEYHETVDDNAYTNGLAAYVLWHALALADDLAADEPERWSGLEQFAGYHALDPINLSGHDPSIATVDAKLGWYAMQRTRVLKQADVLMLLLLLWERFPPEVHAANFAYYEPATSHDSSLSYSMHALFAARLGKLAIAEGYLRRAALIDLDLDRKGHAGATGGVHIAALGGLWQALAMGFMGMQPTEEGLRLAPHIPEHWGQLELPISWRGGLLRAVALPSGQVSVSLERGAPVRVALHDGPWHTLAQGETLHA